MDVILASTSPYRQALLRQVGLTFRVAAPGVDEAALIAEYSRLGLPQNRWCEDLALAKATAVAEQSPGSIVLGGDQMLLLEGEAFGKPGDLPHASRQLRRLSGRTHELLTAWVILSPTTERSWRRQSGVVVSRLTMRTLTDPEIDRYLAADSPLDCAGSYRLEGLGIAIFDRIESPDHTAIIGLPLLAVTAALRQLDLRIP